MIIVTLYTFGFFVMYLNVIFLFDVVGNEYDVVVAIWIDVAVMEA